MTLASELITEKNKISNTSPWIILLDVVLIEGYDTIYLTNNTEEVSFGGNTYSPFPMEINHVSQSIDGDIPEINILVSNTDRVIQGYIESLDGAVDRVVTIRIVHQGNLAVDYADLTRNFKIQGTVCTNEWVTFNLGLQSPTQLRFPPLRVMGNHCNWLFKGAECGYTGETASCDHTLTTCRSLGRSTTFGGFPGFNTSSVRFV